MIQAIYHNPLLRLPRWLKRFVVIMVDICLCLLTVWLAFAVRLGELILFELPLIYCSILSVFLAIPIFAVVGLYTIVVRFSDWYTVSIVAQGIGLYTAIFITVISIVGVDEVPRTIGLIQPILLFGFVSLSRVSARLLLIGPKLIFSNRSIMQRALIYGAGRAGRSLAAAIRNSQEMVAVGFLDDDKRLQGSTLMDLRVFDPNELSTLIEKEDVTHVFLAIPSLSRSERRSILSKISGSYVVVRTLPSLSDIADGRISVNDIIDLDADDLLCREVVNPDPRILVDKVADRVVLVTGAGGSIGSEICRQIVELGPRVILLLEISEVALYQVSAEVETLASLATKRGAVGPKMISILGSVQDVSCIRRVLNFWKPDTIYHCAAYKHVPIVEGNVIEGFKNNVLGTEVVALEAIKAEVKDLVLISSDKAVRPTNIMGATKRIAEMILQALQKRDRSKTCLSMVRFGNVLESSGSVIPVFRSQIKDGGPVTVTHKEVTRFFMTIPEAAQLVLQASSLAKGGEVFLLDMGDPVKIFDLANRMISMSGLKVKDDECPDGDIEIEIIGLRPGEKLYEELLIDDNAAPTQHPKIMVAQENFLDWNTMSDVLNNFKMLIKRNDEPGLIELVATLVEGFDAKSQR